MSISSKIRASKALIAGILKKLKTSAFVKNVLIVMSGTVLAQIISFALSPIISRLYSPADFGVFGSFSAVLSVIAAGLTLDYSQAIMIPKQDNEAINLFMLSFLSTISISACCLVACLLAPALIRSLMKTSGFWILALLVIGILVNGLNQTFQAWCVRVKSFKHTSASQVIRSVSSNGTQIGLGYLGGGPLALIFSTNLGEVLASLNLGRVVLRDLRNLRPVIKWKGLWRLAISYHDFPLYSASINVINTLSMSLPVLLLTQYYGIAVAGSYAFGMRMLSTPLGFIMRSLRQVLYQKACETHSHGGRLVPLYVKFTVGLFALALVPSVIFMIWAPRLFTWVFGTQWLTAGQFAQSLVIWTLFMFSNLPADLFVRIIRMQRKMFIFDVTLLAARTAVLVAGGLYWPASKTILLFSVVGAIMNIIFIAIIGYAVMRKEGDITFKGILNGLKEGSP